MIGCVSHDPRANQITSAPSNPHYTTMAPSMSDLHAQILKQDAFEDLKTKPVYLAKVEVNGGDRFTREFFNKLLTPLVEQSDYTFSQLLEKADQSYVNLEKTQVFKQISPSFHIDYILPVPEKPSYNIEKPIVAKVIFDLEPAEISAGEASLGFNSEDNLVVDLGYVNNNFNHNAELVNIGVNYRPYKPSEHLVSTMRVVSNLRNPTFKFILDLYNSHDNNQLWQQNSSRATGGVIGVSWLNLANTFSVFNGLALTKRTIYDIDDGAQDSLKVFGGDYLKSSIVSRLAYSNVGHLGSSHSFPASGISATLSNEICLDQEQEVTTNNLTVFVKTATTFNLYKSFLNNALTAHFFKEAGAIYTSSTSGSGIHLADRFYLGGFSSFRGFARNSVNEQGGSQFYKAGLTLYSKLPTLIPDKYAVEPNPLRLYATGAVGSVGDNVFKDDGVFSAGVGLKFFNKWAHLDAGYYVSQRLNSSNTYGVRDGFQLEISLGGTTRT